MIAVLKISVIVNAHNRKQYLAGALKSIAAQSLEREKYEVIVVKNFDDQESDSFSEENGYRLIRVPDNTIVGYDLFTGISSSSGEVISFLDDDDLFDREKLKIVYDVFQNPDICYMRNELEYIDTNGKLVGSRRIPGIRGDRTLKCQRLGRKAAFLNRVKAGFNLSSISIRRDILDGKILDFLENMLVHSTDTFFLCCALDQNLSIFLTDRKLTKYRVGNSASRTTGKDRTSVMKTINFFNNLISTYGEFRDMFGGAAPEYLETRICAQKVAREIRVLRNKIEIDRDFSPSKCIGRAIRTGDLLLCLDLVIYFRTRFFGVSGI